MTPSTLLHPLKLDVVGFQEDEHDYHFRVKEGVFYAVCGRHSQRCITLYDRSILREVRQSRRFRMRVSGKREREIAK